MDMTLSVTAVVREYVMVAMIHDMIVPGRVCMSVSGRGYVSLMVVGGEMPTISSNSQA